MKRYVVEVTVDWDEERFGEPEPEDLYVDAYEIMKDWRGTADDTFFQADRWGITYRRKAGRLG